MLTPVCSSLLPEPPQNSEKVYMNNAKARMRSTEAEGSRGHGSVCQGRREKLSPVLKEDPGAVTAWSEESPRRLLCFAG